MSRTTEAYTQVAMLDTAGQPLRLHKVGPNWTRTAWRKDSNGLWLPGMWLEPERTNYAQYSCDLTNWTIEHAGDAVSANVASDPFGESADGFVLDATNTFHRIRTATTGIPTGIDGAHSAIIKAGTHTWVNLAQIGGVYAYFDLSSGTVGTHSGTAYMEALGDDWWWLEVRGTTNNQPLGVVPCDADGDTTTLGDGSSVAFYMAHAQSETTALYRSSPIRTTSASVTRTADSAVVYDLSTSLSSQQWTLLVPVVIPEHTPSADLKLLSLYEDGAAGTDHVTAWVDTSGYLKLTSAMTGGSAGAVTVSKTISDGKLHWLSIHAKHGKLAAFVDHVNGNVDMDAGIAASINRLSIEPSGAWVGQVSTWRRWMDYQPRPLTQATVAS